MREAWRTLRFADEALKPKIRRDPVAAHTFPDGSARNVSARYCRNFPPSYAIPVSSAAWAIADSMTFQMTTIPNPTRQRALQLLPSITV